MKRSNLKISATSISILLISGIFIANKFRPVKSDDTLSFETTNPTTETESIEPKIENNKKSKFFQVKEEPNAYVEFEGKRWLVPGPQNQKPPKSFGIFTYDQIITEWLNAPLGNTSSLEALTKTKHTGLDYIKYTTEGNLFEKYPTINFNRHVDPGKTKSQDKYGKVNSGGDSVNCFTDRPTDLIVSKVCLLLFQKAGITRDQIGKMSHEEQAKLYYKYKFGIHVSNFYAISLRKESKTVLSAISNNLAEISTTEKIYFLDQLNQLGLGSTLKYINIYKDVRKLSKADVIEKMKKYNISIYDGHIYTGFGYLVNLDDIPAPILKMAFSKAVYHNKGTKTNPIPNAAWLTTGGRKWTFGQLNRENPELLPLIQKKIKEINPNIDIDNLKYLAIKNEKGDMYKVKVIDNDTEELVYTQSEEIPPSEYNIEYTPFDVAFLDSFRRIYKIPATKEEAIQLMKDSDEIAKNIHEQFNYKP
jgi:hypothetical protein